VRYKPTKLSITKWIVSKSVIGVNVREFGWYGGGWGHNSGYDTNHLSVFYPGGACCTFNASSADEAEHYIRGFVVCGIGQLGWAPAQKCQETEAAPTQ
jgi:hypothetical protein